MRFKPEDVREMERLLLAFQTGTGASYCLLLDRDGWPVACTGGASHSHDNPDTVAALAAGYVAAARAMGDYVTKEWNTISFSRDDLQQFLIVCIPPRWLLAAEFPGTPLDPRPRPVVAETRDRLAAILAR